MYEIIPVDGREEVVGFDFILTVWEKNKVKLMFIQGKKGLNHRTYKILPGAQSVCAVLVQQPLQEGPGCAGCTGAHPQRLVEDIVVHFMRVSAIEGWLRCGIKEK